ncbi:hypothetical protein [Neorhodopirellula lusitana]|uniref:hypothetical protein n=1 Tax=Neorhodopirellula lusitana TaxID=445327 RepID=UPI00384BDCFD
MQQLISRSYTNDWIGIQYGVVYQLDDGSKWKIIDSRCRIGNGFRKKVTVTKCGGKYRLAVEGDRKKYEVVPMVLPRCAPVPEPKSLQGKLMACLLADLQLQTQKQLP